MFCSQDIQVFVLLTIPWFTESETSQWVFSQTWVYKIEKILRYETERSEVKTHSRSEWENTWGPGGHCKSPSGVKGQSPLRGPEAEPQKIFGL